jgi:MFS family permease
VKKNIAAIFSSTILFSFGIGMYDFVLPYLLDARGITFTQMGYIFSVGAMALFLMKIYGGHLSDRFGRKRVISTAMTISAVSTILTPIAPRAALLALLKMVREIGYEIVVVLRAVALYENWKGSFMKVVGAATGLGRIFEATGILVAGQIVGAYTETTTIIIAGSVMVATSLLFFIIYHPDGTKSNSASDRITLKQVIRFDVPRELKVLALFRFVFNCGLFTSHCFIMMLFFRDKFALALPAVAVIMFIHRISLGFPMLIAGHIIKKHLKPCMIIFVIFEGVTIIIGGAVPKNLWLMATVIWLSHDVFGAGLWSPIFATMIQKNARSKSRGADAAIVSAIGDLGKIIGPLLAGFLAGKTASGEWLMGSRDMALTVPMIVSGALMVLSSAVIFLLKGPYE